MSNKGNDSGEIPNSVIHNINEHAIGGFILFYFNNENGTPEHVLSFDSPVHAYALQKYMSDWLTALNSLNIDVVKENIINTLKQESENDDDFNTTSGDFPESIN